jgi:hypothetical protein
VCYDALDASLQHIPPGPVFESSERHTVASYERERTRHRLTESLLRAALARLVKRTKCSDNRIS